MKYLKLFDNHSGYSEYLASTEYMRPNVSHCIQENDVHYTVPIDWSNEYFTIESLENSNTIYLKASNSAVAKAVSVSTDNGATWAEYVSSTGGSGTTLATLNNGDKLLVKGENTTYATSTTVYNQFDTTGQFEVKGNIMSLISGDSFTNADELTATYTFDYLFRGCTGLTSAVNLVLPATILASYCYYGMFYSCTNLTTAPELPATTLTQSCYSSMFFGCRSLTAAPVLPATTLANNCYNYMFQGCTSLTTAPELPATTLTKNCYDHMFQGCSSLTTVPELPATTLANYCYFYMFYNCSSLTTAPNLPATTLVSNCYSQMFNGCTNLNSVTCLATDISATNCTNNWLNGVASSGTFTKAASMEGWTTGTSGIPANWTVQNATE